MKIQLTAEEKVHLESIKTHPGYIVLEKIEIQAAIDLGNLLLTGDLEDEAILTMIKKNQLYAKARKDFFSNIEKHIAKIYQPDV